jgi:hypothetical protein
VPWRERDGGSWSGASAWLGVAVVALVVAISACGGGDATSPPPTFPPTTFAPPTTHVGPGGPNTTPTSRPTPVPSSQPSSPPTSVPSTTIPQPPSAERQLAACEARVDATKLQVAFVPAAHMVQDHAHDVGAVVGLQGAAISAVPGAGTSPTTIVAYQHGRCELSARLTGSGFDIDPSDDRTQSFLDTDQLTWSWSVTPRAQGELTLHLAITPVLLSAQFQAMRGAEQPFEAQIAVVAAPDTRSWIRRRWDGLNDVFATPLGGALLTVLIGGLSATGIVKWVRSRRRPRPPAPYEGVP